MSHFSCSFKRAITRSPSPSIVDELRAHDIGTLSLDQMLNDHKHYVDTLRSTGAEVIELPPLAEFPELQQVPGTQIDQHRATLVLLHGDLRHVKRARLLVDYLCDALLERRADFIG
mgnify:CR=1 FL=1